VGRNDDASTGTQHPSISFFVLRSARTAFGVALAFSATLALSTTSHAVNSRVLIDPIAENTSGQFAYSVSGAGDVNGDGFDDVIVGDRSNDAGGSFAGRAYVYFGGPGADTTADLTFTGEASLDNLGTSVSGAGDVNGDGFDDVIVGAPQNSAGGGIAGRAYVFFGGPGADAVADLILTGESSPSRLGGSVSGAGDVNGDGFADVIVGARGNTALGTDTGRAYVYYGGPGADNVADLTMTGETANSFFGNTVSGAGDVNGDDFDDVIVGAPSFPNDIRSGRAYGYFGGSNADTLVDQTFNGEASGNFFGNSVSSAGDVNGDGFSDLVIGADGSAAGGFLSGRA
jgi:hypothetical protein